MQKRFLDKPESVRVRGHSTSCLSLFACRCTSQLVSNSPHPVITSFFCLAVVLTFYCKSHFRSCLALMVNFLYSRTRTDSELRSAKLSRTQWASSPPTPNRPRPPKGSPRSFSKKEHKECTDRTKRNSVKQIKGRWHLRVHLKGLTDDQQLICGKNYCCVWNNTRVHICVFVVFCEIEI